MSLHPRAAVLIFGVSVVAVGASAGAAPIGCLFPHYVADIVCGDDGATVCVGMAPDGWSGPVQLVLGATLEGGCPPGLDPLGSTHYASPNGLPAVCTCTCDPTGITCAVSLSFFADPSCSDASSCDTTIQVTSCAKVGLKSPADCNGIDASAIYALAPPPSPMGQCQASPAPSVLPPPFDREALLCAPSASVAGCAAGEQCVPRLVGCFYRDGKYECTDPSLATDHPGLTRTMIYTGWTEHRGCGSCQCSGLCAGGVNVYHLPVGAEGQCASTDQNQTLPLGQCPKLSGSGWPGLRQYEYSGPTCTAAAPPTGAITTEHPVTVCCPP
jgi:hypothetical protein